MKSSRTAVCPHCGFKSARVEHPPAYSYAQSGLDVVLHGGVTRFSCPNCKGKYISIQNEPQLLQVLALSLLARPGFLRGKEVRYLRRICGLTQGQLAEQFGYGRHQTVLAWESKESVRRDPATEVLLRLVFLKCFRKVLDQGEDHLKKVHTDALREFEQQFTVIFENLLRRPTSKKLSLEKPGDQPWQMTETSLTRHASLDSCS